MKDKLGKIFSAGLFMMSAAYISVALMATGCSSDNSSVMGGDTEEYSEVVEPSAEETTKAEEPSDSEENVESEKTADTEDLSMAEEKPVESENPESSESEEPAESGDVTEPEESAESNKAEPTETAEPVEENPEQAELSNSEEKTDPAETTSSEEENESVELNNAKEWEIIRDSVTSVVENNSIQYLHETRSFRLDRSDKILRLDEYRMPKDDFVAEYQYDGYDQHLTDRLYEDEILWEGFNWTNLNKPECRFKAGLDSILVGTNWPEIYVEMYAIYDVRYFCQSLGLEGNLSIWIPVRYRAKQD